MEFNFPFPSLQQLSTIAVCQHWSDNNLGVFSEIRNELTVASNDPLNLFDDYSYMVKQLSIPAELKPAICEMLFGICQQIHDWAKGYSRYPSVDKFYIDPFGRFDIDRTVEHFYKNQVAATEVLSTLHELFSEAVAKAWIPEMDMVLRKMVAVALQPMDVPLEGPSYDLQDGNLSIVMRYTFLQNLDSTTADKLKCLTSLISKHVSIGANDEGLVLMPKPTRWSFKLFERLHKVHETVEERFVLYSFCIQTIPTSHLLQVLTFMEKANKQKWFSYVSKNCKASMDLFLERLLVWPYTKHFVPAFKLMYPYLGRSTCRNLLYTILLMMMAQEWCGMLHDDLLMDFWSVMSVSTRRWCAVRYMEKTGPVFLRTMRELGWGKKATLIHNAIMADALPKECPKLRHKRKHE